MCVYVCVCVCVCLSVYVCMYVCLCMYVCGCVSSNNLRVYSKSVVMHFAQKSPVYAVGILLSIYIALLLFTHSSFCNVVQKKNIYFPLKGSKQLNLFTE
jgi:hypothetical protein